ncbi:MAG: hypothetical protein IPP94_12515 [Ignavibacteria bacterium]|nr:hypothetical protein [Ignavibacteria bacterium]
MRGLAWSGLAALVFSIPVLAVGAVDHPLPAAISWAVGRPAVPSWIGNLHFIGLFGCTGGGILALCFGLLIPRWNAFAALRRIEKYALIAGILLVLLFCLPIAFHGHSATFGQERYWWLEDDAMISMRYAHNLADGEGLVWNPGERVEGYSNFLWTLYMALVHLLPLPLSKTSAVILVTNILLAVATVPVLILFVRALGGGGFAVLTSVLAFTLCRNAMVWVTGGLETTFLGFVVLLALLRIVREADATGPKVVTCLLIGMLALIRADAVVLSMLLCAFAFAVSGKRKTVTVYALLACALAVLHELFRLHTYGALLPNTAYLKTAQWSGRNAVGLAYVADFAKSYALFLAFAAFGALTTRRKYSGPLIGVLLVYAAWTAFIGGDVFHDFRYFVPLLPVLMALAFLGMERVAVPVWVRGVGACLCLASMPLFTPDLLRYYLYPIPEDAGNVRIGLLLKKNTAPAARVADFWAGSVFYFSERYGIDLLGKSDRRIATMPVLADRGGKPGHNKFDFGYSIDTLRADIVIANFRLPVSEDVMRRDARGDWAFTGQLYFHPAFRERFISHPVRLETWRTIFVSDRSAGVPDSESWKEY